MKTKKQLTNRILSLALALVMVLGMMPLSSLTAFAEDTPTQKNIMLGTSHIKGAQQSNVFFGNYYQSDESGQNKDPIKWRVLSNTDGKLLLLSDQNLDVFPYHIEMEEVTWETSTMRSWLNGLAENKGNDDSAIDYANDNFLDTAFSPSEQTEIVNTTVVNSGSKNTTDKVFLLSIEEAMNTAYGFTNDKEPTDTRKSTNTAYTAKGGRLGKPVGMYGAGKPDHWWLRSTDGASDYAPYVKVEGLGLELVPGKIIEGGMVNYPRPAVRPAFHIDLSSVLFTSAANGGKPQGFNAVEQAGGNDWKLTLLDSSRNFAVSDTTAKTVNAGDTLSLGYTRATTGTNEYISAMLVDANGEVVYYGQLAQPTAANGTVTFDVPSDMEGGTYTLKLFNEQINGDRKTDYSSKFVDIALTVIPAATVSFDANGGTDTMNAVKVEKNSDYTLPANGFTAPTGYRFKGWATSADGSVISGTTITVTADITLYAVWEKIPAEAPTVTAGDNVTLTYKGYTDVQVSVRVTEKDGYTYSYQWYDGNDQLIDGATNSAYPVPRDLTVDSYSYYCRVTATRDDNGLTNSADSAKITVTVNKATPGVTAPIAKENLVYDGAEQELISAGSATSGTMQYALGTAETVTGEWKTDIPKATKADTYYVWYKVVGNDNYNDVEPACITVKIEKATLTVVQSITEIDWYPGMSIDYDASALKNLFTVTDASEKDFTFKINAVYNSDNQPIEEIVDAGVYTIELQPFYNNLVGNYSFGTKPLTLTVKHLDLTGQSVTRHTSLDPTYTGETALPLATSSGKLNFDIGEVYDILTKKDRSRTLWANDGYWKFEVIEGKNSTDAGDAYINIVGLGGNVRGSCEFKYTIKQKEMDAPVGLQAVDETISKKKDGKINGLTTAMEYSTSKYGTYKEVTDVNMLFEADTYYVRTAAPNANYKPSDPVEITIGEGRKLTVTIPTAEEQIGYTLTVNTNEINWHGRVAITLELADGYSKSNTDFAVKVNGTAVPLDDYGKYIVMDAESDLNITVSGVVDETAPEAEISISTNKWTDFLNTITLDTFFKETENVTITATDNGSGVDTIYYFISETDLAEDEVKALASDKWTEYDADNKPSIAPDKTCIVYAKVTDKAQNVTFIRSTGLVFDGTAPAISGIENGRDHYGDVTFAATDALADVKEIKVDGNAVTLTEGKYTITADNAEHTVTVTDNAGNTTEWKIVVYKNYTVTYKVDGEVVDTVTVGYGKDATAPTIPEKEGYTAVWDKDGKNITADTEIHAVYSINKYTVTFMDENGVYYTVTVKHGEKVTMPEVPKKDGYTVKWEKVLDTVTEDVTVKAVYTEIPTTHKPSSPQTGDTNHTVVWLLIALMSGGALLTVSIRRGTRSAHAKR